MSKKDYQAIARAIHEAREESESALSTAAVNGVMLAAQNVADVLAADRPEFDRERFLQACETGSCKGMPARPRFVGCQSSVCVCHDRHVWTLPGSYPDGCSSCGCRRA